MCVLYKKKNEKGKYLAVYDGYLFRFERAYKEKPFGNAQKI